MAWEKDRKTAFDRHVAKSDGCWIWTGSTFAARGGYGAFSHRPSGLMVARAHRVAYALHYGPITEEQHVLHKCDNPRCVNPAHLFLGHQTANMADKVDKGRQDRGSSHGMAKLSEESVAAIRSATGRQADMAARFGVSVMTISDIRRGKTWRHVQNPAN